VREPIPTWFFALVVCRRRSPRGDEFLVVHETSHGQRWWLPGGRVEAGEGLAEAARRECEEESGIPVVLERLLRLEHTPHEGSARVRAVFLARPADDRAPKSTADEHSLEAAWRTLAEVEALDASRQLRGADCLGWFRAVTAGDEGAPLSVLGSEG
jgi:ADP-ribose pyrophosphatase YjhB (NUDIX family)